MINLAGVITCDYQIELELKRCKVEIVKGPLTRNEVPYSLTGRIGQITLSRAWRYWIAKGSVPLNIARELYADPVGRTDIRVVGHCGCPAPVSPWVTWRMPDGKEVLTVNEESEAYRLAASDNPVINEIGLKLLRENTFNDDPASIGASAFIETYHIDTELGLYVFARAVESKSF